MENPRVIAIFDFDGTLIKGDSLWPFLYRLAGGRRSAGALLKALLFAFSQEDGRTAIKEGLLRAHLENRCAAELAPAIADLKKWVRWIPSTVAALQEHHAKGHHILIASGSLDLYLPALLEGIPYDGLLCTSIGQKDGVLTGAMEGGNCVRRRKAERVKAYIEAYGPFADSWGYGNAPHDLPMLDLVQHRVVV
jgi:HAD superfamily hydrolase (TIGR01490 family)